MTAFENVALPATIAGLRRSHAERRALDLLDLLGLTEKALEFPAALSGGQRQRLAIARALANEPTLLIADEPTGALDSEGAAEILELLRRLHAEGQTILLVTHDERVAAGAGRLVRDEGRPRRRGAGCGRIDQHRGGLGMSAAVSLCLRAELRSRGRAWLVLALVIGLGGGSFSRPRPELAGPSPRSRGTSRAFGCLT